MVNARDSVTGEAALLLLQTLGLLAVHALSWLAVCHALLNKRDPRSALGWSAASLLLPGVGPLLYAIFGISRAERRGSKIVRRFVHEEDGDCREIPAERLPEGVAHMELPGHRLTRRPLSEGNALTPLFNGDEAYPAMLKAIEQAKRHVFLVTYIFNDGVVGAAFAASLSAAAARGVDVRVLVDGVGMLYSWNKPWKKLSEHGVRTATFLPPRLFPPSFAVNLRNHRKMLICDEIAFTGGMNISDNNLQNARKNCVQDMHFTCTGPIVGQLRHAFLRNWSFARNEDDFSSFESPPQAGKSLCRVVMDGPTTDTDVLNDLFCGVINAARRSIRIMTPYFLPSRDLVSSLRSAAHRGVDVRVVVPAENNLPFVHWAMLRLLPALLEAGVRVWMRPKPFAHTKLLVIDGRYSQIGSANLDARSLRLNFELNMEVFDVSLYEKLTGHVDGVIEQSREITLAGLKGQSLPVRLRNAACWVFSPYL
jgi:cardiolipin synthase